MKSILANIVFFFAVIFSAAAALFGYMPAYEISFITTDGGQDAETVISWDITGAPSAADIHGITRGERFFSVEKYDGDIISSSFYIGLLHNIYNGVIGCYDAHIFRMEAYKDIDAAWINFEIGF